MESGCKQLGLARLTIAGARLLGKARATFLTRQITLPALPALQVASHLLLASGVLKFGKPFDPNFAHPA